MANIFEFLGKPADYRPEKKIFQLVKHFDDVNPKAEQGIYHKKVEFPMYGQVKRDGVFVAVAVTPKNRVDLFNRTGKQMQSCIHLHAQLVNRNLPTGIYFGELLSEHECSLEQLSGVVNPNRTKALEVKHEDDGTVVDQPAIAAGLYIDFFDGITICEFISGHSHRKYTERWGSLMPLVHSGLNVLHYTPVNNEEELRAFAKNYIDLGEEGAVFKQDVEWKAGAKDWHQMKVVRGVTHDCECIGWEEGTGKYAGKVANLLFRFKGGKTLKAMLGKGWTHEDAETMFVSIDEVEGLGEMPELYELYPIGKIFEVYGLQPSSKNGLIRLPKVGELRHDKSEPDF